MFANKAHWLAFVPPPAAAGPTRLYLPSTGAAAVSPAYDAGWDQPGSATRLRCVTSRIGSAMAAVAVSKSSATVPWNVLHRQYVSDPIGAQVIAGTLKGQVLANQNVGGSSNCSAQLLIRVVSGDGSTVRGTLLAMQTTGGSTFNVTTDRNIRFPHQWTAPGASLSSVTAQSGDRLVIEIGHRTTRSSSGRVGSLTVGDDSGTDLPEDETTTAANNPWLQFSQTLLFL